MNHFLSKLILGAVLAAAALAISSCNTVSGIGQDLQDASSAVQNR